MGVGDTLALPPAGDLTLYEGDEPLLLASGGVGQTPLLPMARQALAQGRRMVYLHAALDPDHHAFRDEVAALAEAHPQRLRTVTVHERGDDADHVGRVDRELLAHYLPAGGRCYFVGPQGFMTVVDRALEALGVPAERRHYEHFGPSRPPTPPESRSPHSATPVSASEKSPQDDFGQRAVERLGARSSTPAINQPVQVAGVQQQTPGQRPLPDPTNR
ncbi:MAG: hypothetical protein ACLFSR_06300 [Halomonas sp.]